MVYLQSGAFKYQATASEHYLRTPNPLTINIPSQSINEHRGGGAAAWFAFKQEKQLTFIIHSKYNQKLTQ